MKKSHGSYGNINFLGKEIKMKRKISLFLCIIAAISILFTSCSFEGLQSLLNPDDGAAPSVSLDTIPDFDGSTPYVLINENVPFFTDEKTDSTYETFSELDSLGRCGVAISCIGTDLMPTEDRGSIGHVKPSGWHSVKYDIVDGKYLYNRCHLIGFQLTGENDNEKNLITGTRYMNVEGMLPFENMVADYVKETGNHVLYRVTPIYDGYNLVANGVLIEAKSVEDDEISFCVYVYNEQPGIVIDFKTGESRLSTDPPPSEDKNSTDTGGSSGVQEGEETFILNTSSKKFHKEDCSGVKTMSESNKSTYTGSRQDLIEDGYEACGTCKP
jgi:DNA-entry nuclease